MGVGLMMIFASYGWDNIARSGTRICAWHARRRS